MAVEIAGFLKSAIEHIKPSVRSVAAFAITYIGLLLIPEGWNIRDKVFGLFGDYLGLLHLAGLVSIAYLVTYLVSFLWTLRKSYKRIAVSKAYLEKLSPAEKAILAKFMSGKKKSVSLNLTNGDVAMLETQGIMVRLTTVSRAGMYFDMSLQPWAYDYLEKHPSLLDGASSCDDSDDDFPI